MLHKVTLYFIHKCIDLLFFLRLLFRNLCLFIKHCMSLLPSFLQVQSSACLKKIPSHLGIIICEDRISFNDLANFIIWSFCIGIHHLSIYDSTGFIKSNGNQLNKEVNLRKNVFLKKRASSLNIIFSGGKVPYLYNKITKNGCKTEDINIYLLSHEDGKQHIIKAAKTVCEDAKRKPDILEHFHAQHFENYLKNIIDIPDPELLLLFGTASGLIGYLPWHIRLSEIIFQPTHHSFSFEEFQGVLHRYSKCEQRFGK